MNEQDIDQNIEHIEHPETPVDSPVEYSDSDVDCVIVISHDDEPICFVNNIRKARDRMWELARKTRDDLSLNNYNMYIREGGVDDSIEVIGYHKFYVISYERIMSTFKISKVPRFTPVMKID
jgi:hypothetical protein